MLGGRPPKPKKLHLIEGTLRKHRHGDGSEPEFEEVSKTPPAPLSLENQAKDKWKELAPQLIAVKILKKPDLDALEAYCIAYKLMLDASTSLQSAEQLVLKGAGGGPVANPALRSLDVGMARMEKYGSMLGLNPVSRAKLGHGGGEKDTTKKGFAQLLPPEKR